MISSVKQVLVAGCLPSTPADSVLLKFDVRCSMSDARCPAPSARYSTVVGVAADRKSAGALSQAQHTDATQQPLFAPNNSAGRMT